MTYGRSALGWRQAGFGFRPRWTGNRRRRGKPTKIGLGASLVQPVFAESHAAAVKHPAIRDEKTIGVVKVYLQLNAVTATKQMASAQAMLRTRDKVSAGSPPSSHATTAANRRNTVNKSPKALKKSQYVRVNPCASKWTERIKPSTASAPHSGSFWRNPKVCPAANSSRRTEEIR